MKKYKQKRKLVGVKCDGCNVMFNKPESEYKRNLKLNRRNFCTRSCVGKHNNSQLDPYKGNLSNLISNNRDDEYTPYKYYMKLVRQRYKEYNITLVDLHNQWELQKGICPYSGIKLILSTHSKIEKNPIYSASVDRIDSSKGYTKDNIQFTSRAINHMKGQMSHEDTLLLCNLISQKYK